MRARQASIHEIDSTVTASDVVLTARSASSSSPQAGRLFSLRLSFPAPVDDAAVGAKFNKKKETLNVRLPLQQPQQQEHDTTQSQSTADTSPSLHTTAPVSQTQEPVGDAGDSGSNGCGLTDWAARLSLSNSLLRELCI